MTPKSGLFTASTIVLVVVAIASCNKTEGGSILPPTGPGKTFVRLEIRGPSTVAPNETVQLSAIAHGSDGSTQDVTNEAHWNTSNRSVLTVEGAGRVRGQKLGESNVFVNYSPVSAGREIVVVPQGTYRVVGVVTESDDPGPLPDARVSITGGAAGDLSTTTGADGRYRLYGAAGNVELRVTKDGYEPSVQRPSIADHVTLNAQLKLLKPRQEVSGTYTLSIDLSDSCSFAGLPDDARVRRYTARVVQTGSQLDVRLEGANFALSSRGQGSGFAGRVEPSALVFTLSSYDWYAYGYYRQGYGDVVERLADGRHLIISGKATARNAGSGFAGTLDGSVEIYTGELRSFPKLDWKCTAASHRFMLRP